MKQLILVRHAKAMKRKDGLPDFVRSLTSKGLKQAKNMAKKLRKQGVVPEIFISSPANRALETAQCFAKGYNYSRKKILLKDELYGPLSDPDYLSIVKDLDDTIHSVIFFGHDPVMSSFVQFMAKDMKEDMPTCSVAVIEFKKEKWKDIVKGQGELTFYEYPKRLVKYYTELKSIIAGDVFDQLVNIFKKTDARATIASEKYIKKIAGKTAEEFVATLKGYRKKEGKKKLAAMKPVKKKVQPVKMTDKIPGNTPEKGADKSLDKSPDKVVDKATDKTPGNVKKSSVGTEGPIQ